MFTLLYQSLEIHLVESSPENFKIPFWEVIILFYQKHYLINVHFGFNDVCHSFRRLIAKNNKKYVNLKKMKKTKIENFL